MIFFEICITIIENLLIEKNKKKLFTSHIHIPSLHIFTRNIYDLVYTLVSTRYKFNSVYNVSFTLN